jgi:hypothetical protein
MAMYDQARDNPGVEIPVGRIVCCDSCGKDWTESPQTGGFLFLSKAICPDCAPDYEKEATQYGEQAFIRARCPERVSFADWVRELRGPDAHIVSRGLL